MQILKYFIKFFIFDFYYTLDHKIKNIFDWVNLFNSVNILIFKNSTDFENLFELVNLFDFENNIDSENMFEFGNFLVGLKIFVCRSK